MPSGAEGFDGSRRDCEVGTGPGEHAAQVKPNIIHNVGERGFIVGQAHRVGSSKP
jgi:hypothetical protein